jgi:hypothetical protein
MNQVTAPYPLDGIDGTTWRQTTVLQLQVTVREAGKFPHASALGDIFVI